MQLQALRSASYQALTRLLIALERSVKQCLQPVKPHLIGGALADITRSKSELIAENAFLRQQLIVLQRQTKRPVFTSRDRTLLVLLASRFRWWREALIIVKPDTLRGWHRQGFRLFWRHRSKARRPQPRVPEYVIALIHSMALDNRLWGSKRIRDELRKLGYRLTKRTVAKYMRQIRPTPSPRKPNPIWGSFLKNHAREIWACDFLQTYDLWFRTLFVFFIIELDSRRVVHFAVTSHPSDVWVAQQLREATPFDTRPWFLIRDNDRKYGTEFQRAANGIEVLRTPIRAPKANAVCERFLGSVRRECLDHVIIFNERHLYRVNKEYVAYFNAARPHQGIAGEVPIPSLNSISESAPSTQITAFPILGGLHHDYRRAA
jgi:transposase InsO family protein